MKPRFGLMRGREFLMKDLYSFDINVDKALETYDEICNAYTNIFKYFGIDFVKGVYNFSRKLEVAFSIFDGFVNTKYKEK